MEYVAAVCFRGFNQWRNKTDNRQVKHSTLFRVSNEMCQPVADPGRDMPSPVKIGKIWLPKWPKRFYVSLSRILYKISGSASVNKKS